ncbi:MAG: family 20 glycosylhydrolase [Opitutae bacterium]|nr:family 20 glycosylhydrolase [Opitutae bacterium]
MRRRILRPALVTLAVAAFSVSGFFLGTVFPAVAQESATTNPVAAGDDALADLAKSFSPEQNIDLTGTQIAYKLPAGISAKIVGTTYEQLVDFDGKIRNPISPKTTKLTFELSDATGATATTPTFEVAVPAKKKSATAKERNPKPRVVPALQEWVGAEIGKTFTPGENFRVVIPPEAERGGDTLLRERAELFAAELSDVLGRKIEVEEGMENFADNYGRLRGCVVLLPSVAGDEASLLGKEGYVLACSERMIKIVAADSLGAFWGTRTILQVFKLHENSFPCGFAIDYPQYSLRGFSYDVGRKPTTLESVRNVMKTMAYYKMNDFQLHLSDNFIWLYKYTDSPDDKKASPEEKAKACQEILAADAGAFRIESDVVGKNGVPLTSHDLFYTKKDFGELIDLAKIYGVTIVPEIEVPGHSLSMVRVRPELMYRGKVRKPHDSERTAMLDASDDVFDSATGRTYRDETLSFAQSVFDEYIVGKNGEPPVFRDSPVHIGTDEYYGDAENYRAFTDAMIKYMKSRGRTPRLWGSFSIKHGETPVESAGVQLDVWNLGWQNPQKAIDDGFDIINILDSTNYIVPNGTGNVGGYGDVLDLPRIYSQSWQPNVLGTVEIIAGHPKILGAAWAIWNDHTFQGDTGLVDYDLVDRIQKSCAVIAEKTWNTGEDADFDEFMKTVDAAKFPPLSNPAYTVKSDDDELFTMEFEKLAPCADLSGNGNDATETNNVGFTPGNFGTAIELRGGESFMKTPLLGIAPNYKAEFYVKRAIGTPDDQPQVLFSSPVGKILAVQKDTGKVGITRDTWDYSFDYTLPVGRWVKLTFYARDKEVVLYANDKKIGAPVRNKYPESHKYSTFVFPLEYIGAKEDAFVGQIDSLRISRLNSISLADVVPADDIAAVKASSEHGIEPDGGVADLMDGDPDTYWHSKYNPKDNPPFEIEIEFTSTQDIGAFAFLPRKDSDNGNVMRAKLFAKVGDADWKKIAEFRDESRSRELKKIFFARQKADALKFVILEGAGGFGTIAEIYPLRASKNNPGITTPLAENYAAAKAVQAAAEKKSEQLDAALKKFATEAEDPDYPTAQQENAIRELDNALLAD